jgi:hypothetical protein
MPVGTATRGPGDKIFLVERLFCFGEELDRCGRARRRLSLRVLVIFSYAQNE